MRLVWNGLGFASVGLGIMGYLVPGMPGTVFLILGLYCFAQCENGPMRNWLLGHKWFGKTLRDWEKNRSIPAKIKALAVTCIVVSCSVSVWLIHQLGVQLVVAVLGLIGVAYVLACRTSVPDVAGRPDPVA